MTISEKIRTLAREGFATAEIARQLGIRYQHAYGVIRASGLKNDAPRTNAGRDQAKSKPPLTVDDLTGAGFELSARWTLSHAGDLLLDRALPKAVGVYAFAKEGVAVYVGVATMGLAKRLYYYGKPGGTQRTSKRLNAALKNELLTAPHIDIYTVIPPDLVWNGLPIHGPAGLELGLIKTYSLAWNIRSAG